MPSDTFILYMSYVLHIYIGSLISVFIAIIAAATTSAGGGTSFLPAGFVALGLSYSFQITTYLKFAVRMIATGQNYDPLLLCI